MDWTPSPGAVTKAITVSEVQAHLLKTQDASIDATIISREVECGPQSGGTRSH
jgi:hypothetical protein